MNNMIKRIVYVLMMLFFVVSWIMGELCMDVYIDFYLLRGFFTLLVVCDIPFNFTLISSVFWILLMLLTTIAHFNNGNVKNWIVIILLMVLLPNSIFLFGLLSFDLEQMVPLINIVLIVLSVYIAHDADYATERCHCSSVKGE